MPEHYTLKSGVVLSHAIEQKVKVVADEYYKLTKKDIVITSGTRTPKSQASAMYMKLAAGDRLKIYRDQTAAQAIIKAYEDAVKLKKNAVEIKKDLEPVINTQVNNKTYISKHLMMGAVDVRSRDMTQAEKGDFKKAASKVATSVILETTPPHFHVQF